MQEPTEIIVEAPPLEEQKESDNFIHRQPFKYEGGTC